MTPETLNELVRLVPIVAADLAETRWIDGCDREDVRQYAAAAMSKAIPDFEKKRKKRTPYVYLHDIGRQAIFNQYRKYDPDKGHPLAPFVDEVPDQRDEPRMFGRPRQRRPEAEASTREVLAALKAELTHRQYVVAVLGFGVDIDENISDVDISWYRCLERQRVCQYRKEVAEKVQKVCGQKGTLLSRYLGRVLDKSRPNENQNRQT